MRQDNTKCLIRLAFRRLLVAKPLDKITVRDVVECCGLTRNTFYYHYEDLYDLLDDFLEAEGRRALADAPKDATWGELLLQMLRFLSEPPALGRHILESRERDALRRYLTRVVYTLIDRDAKIASLPCAPEDRALICNVCCYALYGLLQDHLRQPQIFEAEVRRAAELFQGSLLCALEISAGSLSAAQGDKL